MAGEFALVAVDRARIDRLAEEGNKRALSTQQALKTLSFQLSGAQLGITLTTLLVGFLAEPALGVVLQPVLESLGVPEASSLGIAVGLALILATVVQMVVGELAPKNLALARAVPLALWVSTPLRWWNRALKPLIHVFNTSANFTVRLLGIEPSDELRAVHSLEELEILIRSSRETGSLEQEEFSLLRRSISFGDKDAGDALVPRTAVEAISADADLVALTRKSLATGHSRFPVIGSGIDDVTGLAHVKDVYRIPRDQRAATPVYAIMQESLIVPESCKLEALLLAMRSQRKQMAVVIDEYGGTAGIITLEDLLEEIVGEIEDEYDAASAPQLTSSPQGVNVVSGMLHPHEVADATTFEMPEGDYETLAGFLLSLFDRIPSNGDHCAYEGWEFKVVEMDGKRISKVLMVAPPAPVEEAR